MMEHCPKIRSNRILRNYLNGAHLFLMMWVFLRVILNMEKKYLNLLVKNFMEQAVIL